MYTYIFPHAALDDAHHAALTAVATIDKLRGGRGGKVHVT